MYYDRQGKQISVQEWSKLFEDIEYRRLGLDEVGDYLISTVWLGMDHAFFPGEPLIFETMVFLQKGDRRGIGEDQERYTTEADARYGHIQMVAKYKEKSEGTSTDQGESD